MNKTFQGVGRAKIGRSFFDLSYRNLLTGDMGKLYPVCVRECVPGDVMTLGTEVVIRFQPLVAPILHDCFAYLHYFFVPYRLLWDDWESFITGGEDGTEAPTIPTWGTAEYGANTLWDYLGYPVSVDPEGVRPTGFPRRAYALIYNEYYRDQTQIAELDITTITGIQKRAWEKDYFTSALPWQQRGTAPALPISGDLPLEPADGPTFMTLTSSTSRHLVGNLDSSVTLESAADADGKLLRWKTGENYVDLSAAVTFDVSDLRLAFQTQRWLERNARAGARYTEFLQSHFNVAPRDDRLQRPEYIGGLKSPVIISEVLQTSETNTTPQGTMAGHGISVARGEIGKVRAQEFGLIMGILSVMPKPLYQQGIDRQWIKSTKYDFYFPEFAHLSEQPIYNGEIYAQNNDPTNNAAVFGYQERYAEMRSARSQVVAGMRDTYDYWHMSRQFGSLPSLDQTFVECTPRDDCFAAPAQHQLIIHVGNKIHAVRPMPIHSDPGLIDH